LYTLSKPDNIRDIIRIRNTTKATEKVMPIQFQLDAKQYIWCVLFDIYQHKHRYDEESYDTNDKHVTMNN